MKLALLAFVTMLLAGCGAYHVTVYGTNGAAYTAPDVCAAYFACKQAGEKKCYHVSYKEQYLDNDGNIVKVQETDTCKSLGTKK